MTELYEILGVTPDATESEIRRAYRKQAIKWHPDKNPDNPAEAERRFKLVAEAYEVLSDPEKKEVYDEYGLNGVREGASRGGRGQGHHGFGGGGFHVDPFELFRTIFGGNDPFADPFFNDRGGGMMGGGGFGGGPSLFDSMMGGMMGGHAGGMGNFTSSVSSSSMMGGMMGGGTSRSTSTSTVIQNGRRVTRTTTTIRHPDGRVETSTDEQVEEGGPRTTFSLQQNFPFSSNGSLGW